LASGWQVDIMVENPAMRMLATTVTTSHNEQRRIG
jgi:hypothetical protein